MLQNYSELLAHWKKIEVIRSTASILYWDMETYMPEGSIGVRQQQLGLIAQLTHNWLSDPNFKAAVLSDKITGQDAREKRNLELWKKDILVSSSVDEKFVGELSQLGSECSVRWRSAREKANYASVLPIFTRLLGTMREHVHRIQENPALKERYSGKSLYEVSFDQYEPGMSLATMEGLLTRLCAGTKEKLPAILDKIKKRKASGAINSSIVDRAFCERLMREFGFNFQQGRLDTSVHPFSGGCLGDVRMTVRKKPVDALEDLLSTLHEVGHALYEQGVPTETQFEPCGKHCSMGVHESQSRFLENFIGRSRPFCDALAPRFNIDGESLFTKLNPVGLGFIRVDSDEVTYNFHILLRYRIERDLLEGRLEAKDLPERWNADFKALTGLSVPNDGLGCLQDTHWYGGAIGYFPTYSLGNMLAAELYQDFQKEIPDWESRVRGGDFVFVRNFMAERVYPLASQYDSPECMRKILGREVSEQALLKYFDQKFS